MAAAVDVIQEVENPAMPPIVGDGYVVPGEIVGMFATLGRQLQKGRPNSRNCGLIQSPFDHFTRIGSHYSTRSSVGSDE